MPEGEPKSIRKAGLVPDPDCSAVQCGQQISLQTHLGAPEHMALELNPAEEKEHLTFQGS